MNDDQKILNIKKLSNDLYNLLDTHKGQDYLPGIISMIRNTNDDIQTIESRIDYTSSTIRRMLGGAGTLGDYVISTNGMTVDHDLNLYFDDLIKRLLDLTR